MRKSYSSSGSWYTSRCAKAVLNRKRSKLDRIRRKYTTETTPKANGYWRVVKVDLENGREYKRDELFESYEEAEADCKKCQQEWQEQAWDNREYSSMEYQLRYLTAEQVAAEKKRELEAWRSYLRKSYLDPMEPATFTACCIKLMADMQNRVKRQSASDISKMRHDQKDLFGPWQGYGGRAKLWACTHFEPGSQEVSCWGMFVLDSLFGSLKIRIKRFDSTKSYMVWLGNTDEAAADFEKGMLQVLKMEINGKKQV